MTENIHFWIDLETTGLEEGRETILEMAWFFTNSRYEMISPLRQRLTNLAPPAARLAGPRGAPGPLFDTTNLDHWEHPQYFHGRKVMEMHIESGLKEDHLRVDPNSIYTHPRDFERAYLDDLVEIRRDYEPFDKIILSGDGVSHYDCYLLDALWHNLFPLRPNFASDLAYWRCDVSSAARIVDPKVLEAGQKWAETDAAPFSMLASYGRTDCQSVPDFEDAADVNGSLWKFNREEMGASHRAAADVVNSLLNARILRHIPDFVDEIDSPF